MEAALVAGILLRFGAGADLLGQNSPFSLKVDVSLVSLDVAVYNLPGEPVSGLSQSDFILLEDGTPQEIRHFEPSDSPYNTLLMFDVSGSTQAQFPFMLDAANRFLGELRMQDQIAIATFNTAVTKLLDWRTRHGSFQQISVPYAGGGTDFYSALRWAARELGGPSGRKGTIFLTDGYDRRLFQGQDAKIEERDLQEVLKAVEGSRSPFFFVVVGAPVNLSNGIVLGTPVMVPQKKAVERMQTLAERSGGRVLFAKTIQDVASLYQGIARELSASYTLSYHSSRPQADGSYRRIQVQVAIPGFRAVQSRQGYWAKGRDIPERISSATPPGSMSPGSLQTGAGVPVLTTPIEQAMLSAPEENEWRFSWEKIPEAAKYEIRISAGGTAVLNSETRTTGYVIRKLTYSGGDAKGWNWKVRAQYPNGDWGPWSESRPFEVFQNR
jgi:VWFA-related protein